MIRTDWSSTPKTDYVKWYLKCANDMVTGSYGEYSINTDGESCNLSFITYTPNSLDYTMWYGLGKRAIQSAQVSLPNDIPLTPSTCFGNMYCTNINFTPMTAISPPPSPPPIAPASADPTGAFVVSSYNETHTFGTGDTMRKIYLTSYTTEQGTWWSLACVDNEKITSSIFKEVIYYTNIGSKCVLKLYSTYYTHDWHGTRWIGLGLNVTMAPGEGKRVSDEDSYSLSRHSSYAYNEYYQYADIETLVYMKQLEFNAK